MHVSLFVFSFVLGGGLWEGEGGQEEAAGEVMSQRASHWNWWQKCCICGISATWEAWCFAFGDSSVVGLGDSFDPLIIFFYYWIFCCCSFFFFCLFFFFCRQYCREVSFCKRRSMYKTMQWSGENKRLLILSRIRNQRKWPNGGRERGGTKQPQNGGSLVSITYVSAQLWS